jgi:hypothetical protein
MKIGDCRSENFCRTHYLSTNSFEGPQATLRKFSSSPACGPADIVTNGPCGAAFLHIQFRQRKWKTRLRKNDSVNLNSFGAVPISGTKRLYVFLSPRFQVIGFIVSRSCHQ